MDRFRENAIMSLVEGTPRHELSESYGPHLRLSTLLDESPGGLDRPLAYGTVAGEPTLREAIAAAYDVAAEDVVVTVGGIHALFLLAFILCQRGDEAVTTSPGFPPARETLRAVGATVRLLEVDFEHRYQPDLTQLRDQLCSRTKLVSLASPQNPSGTALDPATLVDILELMHAHAPQAYLVLDETYREAVYGERSAVGSAVHLDERVVSVASLSKCHGAPGLRIGWAVSRDAELRRQLVLGKFNTVISCGPVDEALATGVLSRRRELLRDRALLLGSALQRTEAWVHTHSALIEWVRPDAGALCCMRLRPAAFDSAAVSRFFELAERAGVRVARGEWFGDEPRVFRLGFGFPALPELTSGLQALGDVLRASTNAPHPLPAAL